MELREIEIFLTLAEELHFGRTAERLRISQARVSQAISKQERRIGAALFERTSRRVTLTPIGKKLLADLRPVYDRLHQAIDGATALARGHEGTLTVGIMGAMAHEIVPVLNLFRGRYPSCTIQLKEAHFSDPFGPLRAGDVDIQLTWGPVREPDFTVGPCVLREGSMLAVHVDHPLAARETVSVEDLADYALSSVPTEAPEYWIDAIAPFHTPSGRPIPRNPVVITTFQEVLGMVATGVAITPVQEHVKRYYQRETIKLIPIVDGRPQEWYLIWRTAGETTLVRAFAQAARDAVSEAGS